MTEWPFPLKRGNSRDLAQGACLLDAVSWIAYGKLGDHPPCVDPALAEYGRALDDWLPAAVRQRLRRFVPLLAGTAGAAALSARRRTLIWRKAWEIAGAAGLQLRRGRTATLNPIAALELALQLGLVPWSERDRRLYTPAIELLGEAIALGGRTEPLFPDAAIAAAVQRFEIARAA
jgi:hypothetical protein